MCIMFFLIELWLILYLKVPESVAIESPAGLYDPPLIPTVDGNGIKVIIHGPKRPYCEYISVLQCSYRDFSEVTTWHAGNELRPTCLGRSMIFFKQAHFILNFSLNIMSDIFNCLWIDQRAIKNDFL